jgi:hypothetical protein
LEVEKELMNVFECWNEEIFSSPFCGLLIGIYIFYGKWSTETFRKSATPFVYMRSRVIGKGKNLGDPWGMKSPS